MSVSKDPSFLIEKLKDPTHVFTKLFTFTLEDIRKSEMMGEPSTELEDWVASVLSYGRDADIAPLDMIKSIEAIPKNTIYDSYEIMKSLEVTSTKNESDYTFYYQDLEDLIDKLCTLLYAKLEDLESEIEPEEGEALVGKAPERKRLKSLDTFGEVEGDEDNSNEKQNKSADYEYEEQGRDTPTRSINASNFEVPEDEKIREVEEDQEKSPDPEEEEDDTDMKSKRKVPVIDLDDSPVFKTTDLQGGDSNSVDENLFESNTARVTSAKNNLAKEQKKDDILRNSSFVKLSDAENIPDADEYDKDLEDTEQTTIKYPKGGNIVQVTKKTKTRVTRESIVSQPGQDQLEIDQLSARENIDQLRGSKVIEVIVEDLKDKKILVIDKDEESEEDQIQREIEEEIDENHKPTDAMRVGTSTKTIAKAQDETDYDDDINERMKKALENRDEEDRLRICRTAKSLSRLDELDRSEMDASESHNIETTSRTVEVFEELLDELGNVIGRRSMDPNSREAILAQRFRQFQSDTEPAPKDEKEDEEEETQNQVSERRYNLETPEDEWPVARTILDTTLSRMDRYSTSGRIYEGSEPNPAQYSSEQKTESLQSGGLTLASSTIMRTCTIKAQQETDIEIDGTGYLKVNPKIIEEGSKQEGQEAYYPSPPEETMEFKVLDEREAIYSDLVSEMPSEYVRVHKPYKNEVYLIDGHKKFRDGSIEKARIYKEKATYSPYNEDTVNHKKADPVAYESCTHYQVDDQEVFRRLTSTIKTLGQSRSPSKLLESNFDEKEVRFTSADKKRRKYKDMDDKVVDLEEYQTGNFEEEKSTRQSKFDSRNIFARKVRSPKKEGRSFGTAKSYQSLVDIQNELRSGQSSQYGSLAQRLPYGSEQKGYSSRQYQTRNSVQVTQSGVKAYQSQNPRYGDNLNKSPNRREARVTTHQRQYSPRKEKISVQGQVINRSPSRVEVRGRNAQNYQSVASRASPVQRVNFPNNSQQSSAITSNNIQPQQRKTTSINYPGNSPGQSFIRSPSKQPNFIRRAPRVLNGVSPIQVTTSPIEEPNRSQLYRSPIKNTRRVNNGVIHHYQSPASPLSPMATSTTTTIHHNPVRPVATTTNTTNISRPIYSSPGSVQASMNHQATPVSFRGQQQYQSHIRSPVSPINNRRTVVSPNRVKRISNSPINRVPIQHKTPQTTQIIQQKQVVHQSSPPKIINDQRIVNSPANRVQIQQQSVHQTRPVVQQPSQIKQQNNLVYQSTSPQPQNISRVVNSPIERVPIEELRSQTRNVVTQNEVVYQNMSPEPYQKQNTITTTTAMRTEPQSVITTNYSNNTSQGNSMRVLNKNKRVIKKKSRPSSKKKTTTTTSTSVNRVRRTSPGKRIQKKTKVRKSTRKQ